MKDGEVPVVVTSILALAVLWGGFCLEMHSRYGSVASWPFEPWPAVMLAFSVGLAFWTALNVTGWNRSPYMSGVGIVVMVLSAASFDYPVMEVAVLLAFLGGVGLAWVIREIALCATGTEP
ncbi:MAG: hypothetical protein HY397_03405 [Candidatus Doudnabacteria bacterium]|nr:hypothetical protein [Candidatus Doudnabacteria bacterium]